MLSRDALARSFESLGGGSLDPEGWGFGCEFAYFQREFGAEPIGLLRWASINPQNLIRALNEDFRSLDNPANIILYKNNGPDWGIWHDDYRIRADHSGCNRSQIPETEAKERIISGLRLLRRKLLEDLQEAQKIFVYRVFDHILAFETLASLSQAMRRHGPGVLLYVRLADDAHPAFIVERADQNLLIGYIDAFAPQPGEIVFNHAGWEKICRAAFDCIQR